MKTLVIAVSLLVAILSVPTCAAIKVGSSVPINVTWDYPSPDHHTSSDPCAAEFRSGWIKVMNTDGISSCNYDFAFGEEGVIGEPGQLTVVAISGNRALLEYTTKYDTGGTAIPDGTIFFKRVTEFKRLLAEYEKNVRDARAKETERQKKLKKEKEFVTKLLKPSKN